MTLFFTGYFIGVATTLLALVVAALVAVVVAARGIRTWWAG